MKQNWNSVSEEEVANGCGEGNSPCLLWCPSRQADNNTQNIIHLKKIQEGLLLYNIFCICSF